MRLPRSSGLRSIESSRVGCIRTEARYGDFPGQLRMRIRRMAAVIRAALKHAARTKRMSALAHDRAEPHHPVRWAAWNRQPRAPYPVEGRQLTVPGGCGSGPRRTAHRAHNQLAPESPSRDRHRRSPALGIVWQGDQTLTLPEAPRDHAHKGEQRRSWSHPKPPRWRRAMLRASLNGLGGWCLT